MIQVVNLSGMKTNSGIGDIKNMKFSKLNSPQSLDEFNINVFDLRDSSIWQNYDNSCDNINSINDFKSINMMLKTSTKATNIIVYPQNSTFNYYRMSGRFHRDIELKDMLSILQNAILNKLHPILGVSNIHYENTRTKAGSSEIDASFYFESEDNELTCSIGSCKTTTLDFREQHNVILTTLNLDTYENIMDFLKEIKLIEEREEAPEWMNQYKMFDDKKQFSIIERNNNIISESQENIKNALDVIKQNERYKSILYTNGDELVKVVFEILEEMLKFDLLDFKDEKKEDFAYGMENRHFVGEIKGVTSNVKSEHVSQLEVHYQSYIETNELNSKDVCAILIINHQRNKPLENREPINENQINLSKRNGSLIIETITLLELFEKFKFGEITSEECIEMLSQNTGLLRLES